MVLKSSLCFVVFLIVFLFPPSDALAQAGKLPPFRIMQTNAQVFNATQLPIGKPIILIYFDPDCHDCQDFMGQLFSQIKSFQKASLALITNASINQVILFADKYKVSSYKNMVVGTEGSNAPIGNYYHFPPMPFVALYDKNGNLMTTYKKTIPMADLLGRLGKLK